jgi:hypothetical protein
MPSSKNVLSLSLFLCLSFELAAQYQFLRKGSPSLYDSSVNVDIREYRKIRLKVTLADSLINALHSEINISLRTIVEQDKKNSALSELIIRHEATISAKDRSIQALNDQFTELYKISSKRKKFYQTAGFKYGSGGLGVLIVRKVLISLMQ